MTAAVDIDDLLDPVVVLAPVHGRGGRIEDFTVVAANRAIARFVSADPVVGLRLRAAFPRFASTAIFSALVATVESGEPLVLDDVAYPNDEVEGESRCDVRAVATPRGLVATWRDVTREHDVDAHFRLLAEHSSDIVMHTDLDWTLLWVSPSITSALGWRPDELEGTNLSDVVHPDDVASREERLTFLAAHGSGVFENRIRTADGSYHTFSVAIHDVTNDAGVVTSRISNLRNIDDEVATREALA
ncbi:MAG: PAS domain S-box protein, partial [Acidimicrobiales bacterium]